MIGLIRGLVDRVRGGRGEQSITVPVMDGPLKPNDLLEQAPLIAELAAADNLVACGGRIFASSGAQLCELRGDGEVGALARQVAGITCLAASPDGALALGLDGVGIVIRGGRHDGRRIEQAGACLTAATFIDDDTLAVCNGSAAVGAADWARDLLSLGRSGTVAIIDLRDGGVRQLAKGLAFPSGLCRGDGGALFVTEAWAHRIISLSPGGGAQVAVADLPGYPGRLVKAASGGYWLAMFAVRTQLQEFVLREGRFRREMMATVDPRYWIAPALSSGASFKEPLQAGGVIRLGIHKPWAPSRSYGLVVRLDAACQPMWSGHSRANGRRHGVTAMVEDGGRLLVASRGAGQILALDHLALEWEDAA